MKDVIKNALVGVKYDCEKGMKNTAETFHHAESVLAYDILRCERLRSKRRYSKKKTEDSAQSEQADKKHGLRLADKSDSDESNDDADRAGSKGKYLRKSARPGFPKLKGTRKTIAVKRFRSTDDYRAFLKLADDYNHEGRTTFIAQLVQALKDTKYFMVLNRLNLGDVLDEQDLTGGKRAAKTSAARKGKVIPAQYIVSGTITEFEIATHNCPIISRIMSTGYRNRSSCFAEDLL